VPYFIDPVFSEY